MKNLLTPIIRAVICLCLVQSAWAIQISGKVDMVGTVNLNDANLAFATSATAFGPAAVIPTPNGAFIGTAGSAVTFTPFSWNPDNTPIIPLWSFTSGGWTYTFVLNDITFVSQNSAFVNLAGSGVLDINGVGSPYDPTDGNWTFTITSASSDPEFRFGFVSSTAAIPRTVPESGMTFALLGPILVALEWLRRRQCSPRS